MLAGIRPSLIDEGDTVLVEHWEVSRLWKEAMGCCTDLASFGHECYAYGESSGVDIVEGFLEHSRQLQHRQYACAPNPPGFRARRDHGAGNENRNRNAPGQGCSLCGKQVELKKCARCKT